MKPSFIAITFIWAGLLLGISFLEAPLKFQAPGITLALGLGVGKLVFAALNKIEIVLSFLSLFFLFKTKTTKRINILFLLILLSVAIETLYFLPILQERITLIQSGQSPPSSWHHWGYIALDFLKVLCLISTGFFLQGSKQKHDY